MGLHSTALEMGPCRRGQRGSPLRFHVPPAITRHTALSTTPPAMSFLELPAREECDETPSGDQTGRCSSVPASGRAPRLRETFEAREDLPDLSPCPKYDSGPVRENAAGAGAEVLKLGNA